MKKAIALFLALVSLVTISVPAHAAPADYEMNVDDLTTTSSTYFVPAEEREAEHQRQLEAHLRQLGIDLSECVIVENGTSIMPMNDASNYKVEYLEKGYDSEVEELANQDPGGVSFTYGGSVICTLSGGLPVSFSIPLTIPKINYTFSVSFGIFNSGNNDGINSFGVKIPAGGFYRVKLRQTYEAQYYKIYNKRWNERIWGYEWVEYGDGITHSRYSKTFIVYEV